jgi:hypothetical protein
MERFAFIAVLAVVEVLRRLWQRVTGRVPVPVRVPTGNLKKAWADDRGAGAAGGNAFSRLWLEQSVNSVMGAWRRYRR